MSDAAEQEILRRLTVIETMFTEVRAALHARTEDHERRLRVVEKHQWSISGLFGVLGGAVTALIAYLAQFVHK